MAGYRFLNRYCVLTVYDSNLSECKAWAKGLHSPISLSLQMKYTFLHEIPYDKTVTGSPPNHVRSPHSVAVVHLGKKFRDTVGSKDIFKNAQKYARACSDIFTSFSPDTVSCLSKRLANAVQRSGYHYQLHAANLYFRS